MPCRFMKTGEVFQRWHGSRSRQQRLDIAAMCQQRGAQRLDPDRDILRWSAGGVCLNGIHLMEQIVHPFLGDGPGLIEIGRERRQRG